MITCTFEDGHSTTNFRHVVVDGIIVEDNKILLTKRAEGLRDGGKWCMPGGYVDRDETAVEAVMREIHEETGYTVEVSDLLTVIDNPVRNGDDRQNISFVFIVKPIKKVADLDPNEVSEMKWFLLTELPPEADMAFDHFDTIWQYINSREDIV